MIRRLYPLRSDRPDHSSIHLTPEAVIDYIPYAVLYMIVLSYSINS